MSDKLSCLQIFQGVLGECEHIVLIDIVLRVGALVGGTIGVLHGELTATVANAEESAQEVGIALLSLPDIHLAYPINLAVPITKRIDAVGLRELGVAGFFLIADAGDERGKVEEQTVVVFCPAWTLEGDELGTVS